MSGGYFDYAYSKVQNLLDSVAGDNEVRRRWPYLATDLRELGHVLYEILRKVEWDLSGDSRIQDDEEFEDQARNKLSAALWNNP